MAYLNKQWISVDTEVILPDWCDYIVVMRDNTKFYSITTESQYLTLHQGASTGRLHDTDPAKCEAFMKGDVLPIQAKKIRLHTGGAVFVVRGDMP